MTGPHSAAGSGFQAQSQSSQPRDKSAERKSGAGTIGQHYGAANNSKDIQKDLQKARKAVREKDKEIIKLKSEINHIRRESQEKLKNET